MFFLPTQPNKSPLTCESRLCFKPSWEGVVVGRAVSIIPRLIGGQGSTLSSANRQCTRHYPCKHRFSNFLKLRSFCLSRFFAATEIGPPERGTFLFKALDFFERKILQTVSNSSFKQGRLNQGLCFLIAVQRELCFAGCAFLQLQPAQPRLAAKVQYQVLT